LVGRSVGRSVTEKSHKPHAASSVLSPGPTLPDPLHPAGHPQNGLKFWSINRSVTGKSHKRHAASSVLSPRPALPNPSTPCGPSPKRPYILVDQSVGHREVTQMSHCLFSFVTRVRPSQPLRATSKTALNFGRSVGLSVGRSHGSHTNVTLHLQFCHPGPPFPTLLRPAGHPQNGLKFWSVNQLVIGKSHERHAASSVSSPGPALPDPSTPCGPPPKRP
jgi:hypothetical protein